MEQTSAPPLIAAPYPSYLIRAFPANKTAEPELHMADNAESVLLRAYDQIGIIGKGMIAFGQGNSRRVKYYAAGVTVGEVSCIESSTGKPPLVLREGTAKYHRALQRLKQIEDFQEPHRYARLWVWYSIVLAAVAPVSTSGVLVVAYHPDAIEDGRVLALRYRSDKKPDCLTP